MLYVEKTVPADCFELAPKLQNIDRFEIAVTGLDPLKALLLPFLKKRPNTHTFSIFNDKHEVVAIWGAMPSYKHNDKVGTVYFLASDDLKKDYRYFLRHNKKWIYYLEEHYTFLSNYIIAEHEVSIRWLKWIGYKFKSQVILVNNVKMFYFYKQLAHPVKGTQPIYSEFGPQWATEIEI